MKKNMILCVLIAAALLVTALVASAEAVYINQTTAASTINVTLEIAETAPDSRIQKFDIEIEHDLDVDDVKEKGDEIDVDGSVINSIFNKTGTCTPHVVTIYQTTAPADTTARIAIMGEAGKIQKFDIEIEQELSVDDVKAKGDEIDIDGDATGSTFSKDCSTGAPTPTPTPTPEPEPSPRPPAGGQPPSRP